MRLQGNAYHLHPAAMTSALQLASLSSEGGSSSEGILDSLEAVVAPGAQAKPSKDSVVTAQPTTHSSFCIMSAGTPPNRRKFVKASSIKIVLLLNFVCVLLSYPTRCSRNCAFLCSFWLQSEFPWGPARFKKTSQNTGRPRRPARSCISRAFLSHNFFVASARSADERSQIWRPGCGGGTRQNRQHSCSSCRKQAPHDIPSAVAGHVMLQVPIYATFVPQTVDYIPS